MDPFPIFFAAKRTDFSSKMMPHQSQGACMAIEDAAALGILFNKTYFGGNVAETLEIYNRVRLPRATRVQAAAAKAAYNINERIGQFHGKTRTHRRTFLANRVSARRVLEQHRLQGVQSRGREEQADDRGDECVSPRSRPLWCRSFCERCADSQIRYDMYKDIEEGLAQQKNVPFTEKYTRGLPLGLKMSNGVTVGEP